jgi:hypothetical protein
MSSINEENWIFGSLRKGSSPFCVGSRKNVSLGQGEVFDKAA